MNSKSDIVKLMDARDIMVNNLMGSLGVSAFDQPEVRHEYVNKISPLDDEIVSMACIVMNKNYSSIEQVYADYEELLSNN